VTDLPSSLTTHTQQQVLTEALSFWYQQLELLPEHKEHLRNVLIWIIRVHLDSICVGVTVCTIDVVANNISDKIVTTNSAKAKFGTGSDDVPSNKVLDKSISVQKSTSAKVSNIPVKSGNSESRRVDIRIDRALETIKLLPELCKSLIAVSASQGNESGDRDDSAVSVTSSLCHLDANARSCVENGSADPKDDLFSASRTHHDNHKALSRAFAECLADASLIAALNDVLESLSIAADSFGSFESCDQWNTG